MTMEVSPEQKAELDAKLREGLVAMEKFTRRLFQELDIKPDEPLPGVLRVSASKEHAELLKKDHLLVFDPAVYPEVEDQNAELLTPASPFFRKMMAYAESIGPVGAVQTRRATPYTMFHFHVHLEGMNYEWESIATVAVDDDGDAVPEPPSVRELVEGLEGDRESRFRPIEADAIPQDARNVPEPPLQEAPRLLKQAIAVRLDELSAAVESGLRKTQERLHAYYEQMRDEIRRDEVKLRRRIGELNSRIWYTEDKLRLMRMEKEREILANELKEVKEKTQRTLEHLALEEEERMTKEAERARPGVRIVLTSATRVLPI